MSIFQRNFNNFNNGFGNGLTKILVCVSSRNFDNCDFNGQSSGKISNSDFGEKVAGKFLNFHFNGKSSSQNLNRVFVWLAAGKFLNIDFNGQSFNENLNSVFGEKGTSAGKFFNLAFKRLSRKNSNSSFWETAAGKFLNFHFNRQSSRKNFI